MMFSREKEIPPTEGQSTFSSSPNAASTFSSNNNPRHHQPTRSIEEDQTLTVMTTPSRTSSSAYRRKPKSDSTDSLYGQPLNTVTVNHASRPADTARGPNPVSSGTSDVNPHALPHQSSPPATPDSIEILPFLRDVVAAERPGLFLRKLRLCWFRCDFSDSLKDIREKEIKRQTLLELADFIQSGSCKLGEVMQEELVSMVSVNVFRCLQPAPHENTGSNGADPEDDEPFLEPSWPHLQIVYELLLRV